MKYKDFFGNSYLQILKNGRFRNDDEFIKTVREKVTASSKKNRFGSHAAAAAVMIAAMLIGTISVGAALDWDIASLFSRSFEAVRETRSPGVRDITAFYPELFGKINYDEADIAAAREREYEILRTLSHNLNETVKYGDYTMHIDGYAFDGTRLDILYDLTFTNELNDDISRKCDPRSEEYDPFLENPVYFTVYANDERISLGGYGDMISVSENSISYRYEAEISQRGHYDSARLSTEFIRPEKATVAAFDIGLDDHPELRLNIDASLTKKLRAGERITVNNIRISPFGVVVEAETDSDITFEAVSEMHKMPLYLICKDDSVIDVSGYGNSVLSKYEELDGGRKYVIFLSSRGKIIDINNIRTIKLYSEMIEL